MKGLKAEIEFCNISKIYGKSKVLSGLNLSIKRGDFMVICGLASCGKSVLLRLLMGLEDITEGKIFLRGNEVINIHAKERNIGYVPQLFALYPNLRVYDNIAYPLKFMHCSHKKIDTAVKEVAEMLKISDLLGKFPDKLSGGQKQRVAMARGLVKHTDIFVLDDPLAGLDFKLREQLIDDLKKLQEVIGATFIYATSDSIEAMSLGKHIAILGQGKILEVGDPVELYLNPNYLATIKNLGYPGVNLVHGECYRKSERVFCKTDFFELELDFNQLKLKKDSINEVLVGIRPENIYINDHEKKDNSLKIDAKIVLREDLGSEEVIYLEIQGTVFTSIMRHQVSKNIKSNLVKVCLSPSDIFVFDRHEERLLWKGDVIYNARN